MRFILSAGLAMPLVLWAGGAAAQSRPSEGEIACQLGAAECAAKPSTSEADDGSMVVEDGQRPFCLPGMACARGPAPAANRQVARAVGTVGNRPVPTPGRARPLDRGLRAVRASAPVAAPGLRRPVGTADMALTFANNSAELSADARGRIATFAKVLNSGSLSTAAFRIDGHTNSVGSRESNLDLSRRRAQAVVDYLASLGVSRSRLEAAGHGFDAPLSGARPQDAANRRVEIVKK